MTVYILFIFTLFYLMIIGNVSNKSWFQYNILLDKTNNYNNSRFNIFIVLALMLIFMFSAFRYNIGWDYSAYYKTIEFGINTNIMNNDEYATIMLVNFSKMVGVTNIYFFINSLICLVAISLNIRNFSKDYWMSILLFVCFPLFYLNSFSVIRLFTALGLTFYGFRYIYEQKFYKYLLIILLASMFHMSAVVALSFYLIRNIKVGTVKIIIILISMPFISYIVNFIVLSYLPQYAVYTIDTSVQEGTKSIFVFIFIGMVSLLLRKKIIHNDKVSEIYLNIYFLGLSIYLMFLQQGTMGHRLSLYGTLYALLLVPKIVSVFEYKSKYYLKIITYIALFIMFVLTVQVGEATFIPYKTIFNIN